jgi:hypothetical protein
MDYELIWWAVTTVVTCVCAFAAIKKYDRTHVSWVAEGDWK